MKGGAVFLICLIAAVLLIGSASATVYEFTGANFTYGGQLVKTAGGAGGIPWYPNLTGDTPVWAGSNGVAQSSVKAGTTTNAWYYVYRGWFGWNTSSLPDDEYITDAYIYTYCTASTSTLSDAPMVGIQSLEGIDWNSGGDSDETTWDLWEEGISSAIWTTVDSYTASQYYYIDVDTAWINETGESTFGFILSTDLDYADELVGPTWSSAKLDEVRFDGNYGNSKLIVITGEEPTPTPTPTPGNYSPNWTATVTATPTPRPVTCTYWTGALSSYSIAVGGNTTVTLTETDPDDDFDKIEYYLLWPSGYTEPRAYFVKDNYGVFGFGETWVYIDPISNEATMSSLSAAKSYTIDPVAVAGENTVKVIIYDDTSLLGMIGIHSWQVVCGMFIDLQVGGSSYLPEGPDYPGPDGVDGTEDDTPYEWGPDGIQGTDDDIVYTNPRIGINVWEQDTKAIVYNATVCVYNYDTGAWTNQTSLYGETLYYYVTPHKNIRIVVNKAPWLAYDTTIQVQNPPGTYGVYLKRPMINTENKSWVVFSIKEANTLYPLSGAAITLDTGENTTTNGAGGAQLELDEGDTVYYTISKYGYYSTTDYLTVPADDYYLTVTLNRNPDQILYTPIPTNPEITQVIPMGTPTYSPGANGSLWLPAGGQTAIPTLNTAARNERVDQSISQWAANLPALTDFFIMLIFIGGLGMMMDVFDRKKRRR